MNEINKKLREEWGEIKIHGPPMGATLDIIGWVKLSLVLEKIAEKDKEIKELEKQSEQRANAISIHLQEKLDIEKQLEKERAAIDEVTTHIKKELEDKEEEIKNLRTTKDLAHASLEQARRQTLEWTKKAKSEGDLLDKTLKQLEEERGKVKTLELTSRTDLKHIENLESELKRERKEKKEKHDLWRKAEDEVTSLLREKKSFIEDRKIFEQEKKALEEKEEKMIEENYRLRCKIVDMESQHSDLGEELKPCKDNFKFVWDDHAKLERTIKAQAEKIEEMEKELKNLRQRKDCPFHDRCNAVCVECPFWACLEELKSPTKDKKDVICDGCNVRPPWEHKCHGKESTVRGEQTHQPCECPECQEPDSDKEKDHKS